MSYLQTLAALERSAVVDLGTVRIKVGQSDHDAAVALIHLFEHWVVDGETTHAEFEARIMLDLLNTIGETNEQLPEDESSGTIEWMVKLLDSDRARKWLDALWWARLLMGIQGAQKQKE